MQRQVKTAALILISILIFGDLEAETITEATIGSGIQSNLFEDSTAIGDRYASFAMGIKYYPSASVQISGSARYNAFSEYRDMSNTAGQASLIIIPTPESSPFTAALWGNLSARKFGTLFEIYDRRGAAAGTDIGLYLGNTIRLSASASYSNDDYVNSENGSNQSVDLSAGINTSIAGSNAVAVRLDYSHRSFAQPSTNQDGNASSLSKSESETFDVTGIMVRYSRPLDRRTGLNLSAGYRQLHVDNELTVMGYSIDYLSPWAELWEGKSVSVSFKRYFPYQFITEFSAGYYGKNFVDVLETNDGTDEEYLQDARQDKLTTLSFNISRPISLQGSRLITPSLFLGYRNNRSSADLFSYDDFSAALSMKISL